MGVAHSNTGNRFDCPDNAYKVIGWIIRHLIAIDFTTGQLEPLKQQEQPKTIHAT